MVECTSHFDSRLLVVQRPARASAPQILEIKDVSPDLFESGEAWPPHLSAWSNWISWQRWWITAAGCASAPTYGMWTCSMTHSHYMSLPFAAFLLLFHLECISKIFKDSMDAWFQSKIYLRSTIFILGSWWVALNVWSTQVWSRTNDEPRCGFCSFRSTWQLMKNLAPPRPEGIQFPLPTVCHRCMPYVCNWKGPCRNLPRALKQSSLDCWLSKGADSVPAQAPGPWRGKTWFQSSTSCPMPSRSWCFWWGWWHLVVWTLTGWRDRLACLIPEFWCFAMGLKWRLVQSWIISPRFAGLPL